MTDLVIPGAGEIHLLINDTGNFEAPLSILSETRLRTQLNINRSIALRDRRFVYPT